MNRKFTIFIFILFVSLMMSCRPPSDQKKEDANIIKQENSDLYKEDTIQSLKTDVDATKTDEVDTLITKPTK